MKCTNEKCKLKEILICCFEEKGQKIKRQICPGWIYHFFLWLGSAEEKPNEQRLKVHFVCFTEEKVCFEMEIYQLLALWYWLFSRTDVKFKQFF